MGERIAQIQEAPAESEIQSIAEDVPEQAIDKAVERAQQIQEIMDEYASRPMAYSVQGVMQHVSGSYEAVALCEHLQSEKIRPSFLRAKFEQAAQQAEMIIEEPIPEEQKDDELKSDDDEEKAAAKETAVKSEKHEETKHKVVAESVFAPIEKKASTEKSVQEVVEVTAEREPTRSEMVSTEAVVEVATEIDNASDPVVEKIATVIETAEVVEVPTEIQEAIGQKALQVVTAEQESDTTQQLEQVVVIASPEDQVDITVGDEQLITVQPTNEELVAEKNVNEIISEKTIAIDEPHVSHESAEYVDFYVPEVALSDDEIAVEEVTRAEAEAPFIAETITENNDMEDSGYFETESFDEAAPVSSVYEQFIESDNEVSELTFETETEVLETVENSVVRVVPEEVVAMTMKLSDESPEAVIEAAPYEITEQLATVYKEIALLEKAETENDCREAVEKIQYELGALLILLGYPNGDELAKQLMKKHDIVTIKTYIAALMRTLTQRNTVSKGPRMVSKLTNHHYGSRAVRMVVRLVTPKQRSRSVV